MPAIGVWNASDSSVWVGDAGESGITIRHPRYPCTPDPAAPVDPAVPDHLFRLAHAYLAKVQAARVPAAAAWIPDLATRPPGTPAANPTGHNLFWLGDLTTGDPGDSYWVERWDDAHATPPTTPRDRSAVLLAGFGALDASGAFVPYRAGQGVRVAIHVSEHDEVRIVGATFRLPIDAAGVRTKSGVPVPAPAGLPDERRFILPAPGMLKHQAVAGLGLPGFATGGSRTGENVLVQDPLSMRGAAARHAPDVSPRRALRAGRTRSPHPAVALHDSLVVVPNSPIADGGAGLDRAKPVAADARTAELRSTEAAAVNAYFHARSLFERMMRDGFAPERYFRFAALPLVSRYWTGVGSRRDGRTINAEAEWGVVPAAGARGQIQVRFGLADLSLSPARWPLGLACDPRWNWHEFGHVLQMATVGTRELGFAHSVGDALAAIASDPESALACDRAGGAATNDGGWRGVTFPWTGTPRRRHDRRADEGWSWSGTFYQPERYYTSEDASSRDTYRAEQILSSTLFAFYRAIGGDLTLPDGKPDVPARRAAADYALYLILRALALLGPASCVPALTPDTWVSAMIEADVATGRPCTSWPSPAFPWYGGMTHKVIRWAFQRQGLYPAASGVSNGAGTPEANDIWIAGRPGDAGYGPIDYARPASGAPAAIEVLDPATKTPVAAPMPGSPLLVRIRVDGSPRVPVRPGDVRFWSAVAPLGAVPAWNGATASTWTELPAARAVVGASTTFETDWTPSGSGHALLAAVSTADDRSNLDRESGLPCATECCPVPALAACDNNLALRVV